MTLIQADGTAFKDPVRKWKNEYWESRGITPNEALELDPRYRKLVREFAVHNGVYSPYKFFEVRIVNALPSVVYDKAMKWWTHKMLMDRVFWMFQKPRYDFREGKEPYGYYTLEPFECVRVWQVGCAHLNVNIPTKTLLRKAFTVPIECCQIAWTETSNGFSDHIHHRPEKVETQADIDRRLSIKAAADKLLECSEDINTSKAFAKITDKAVAKLVRNL